MTAGTLLFALLAVAILALSGLNLARLRASTGRRTVLFCIRCALVTALVLAFVQPTMRFSRVGRPETSTLILIDNSRSMSLFRPDSAIRTIRRSLEKSGTKASIAVFGDSLRTITSLSEATFTTSQTRFPAPLRQKPFARQRKVLLVSDGNWRVPGLAAKGLEDRECGYLVLPAINPRPFLMAEAVTGSIESSRGKAIMVPIQLTAFAPHRRQILIESTSPGYAVHQEHVLDSGYAADTVLVSITGTQPGRHLVTLRVRNSADSITTSCGLIHLVVPDTLAAKVNAPAPDLDVRFIILAMKKAGTWKMTSPGVKPYDLLVTYSLDTSVDSLLAGLSPGGVVLAVGALPCKDALTLPNPAIGSVLSNDPAAVFPQAWGTRALPPLGAVMKCPASVEHRRDPTALLLTVTTRDAKVDTIPLVYQAIYRNRPVIVVAGRGLWKWDFLPLAYSDAATVPGAFSSAILTMARNRLIMNLSNRFILFPVGLPLLSSEPISFSVSVPAAITAATAATIRIKLVGGAGVTLDTVQPITVSGASPTSVSVPAQRPGRYLVEATLSTGGAEETCRDSATVEEDNAELRTVQQNMALLDQWGRRVGLNDSAVTAFLTVPSTAGRESATEITEIPIRQSWWLLGCIGAILALEWMVRRRWMAD